MSAPEAQEAVDPKLSEQPAEDPAANGEDFISTAFGEAPGANPNFSRTNSLSLLRIDPPEEVVEETVQDVYESLYVAKNVDVPVVIVSSEINPFSKSGGLALVTHSLSVEFAKRGHRTMAISPMYDDFKNCTWMCDKTFWLFGANHEVKYFHQWQAHGKDKGVDYIFIDHPSFHRPGGLYYNAEKGVEYEDNLFRFALLCVAALEAPLCCAPGGVTYGDKVTFIANDWQTALLPVYLACQKRPARQFMDARCLFIVHNFGYQGIYPFNKLTPNPEGSIPLILPNVSIGDLGLDGTPAYENLVYNYPPECRSYHGDDGNVINLTKGAVLMCDRILTVSKGYADEMKTPEGGFRLEALIKQKEFFLTGILNGIDIVTWNPQTDSHIAEKFDLSSFLTGKAVCKEFLQEKLGLEKNPGLPMLCFIGRLTAQKGIDIILEAMDWLMQDTGNGVTGNLQVVLMGNGDECYVQALAGLEHRWPGRAKGISFNPLMEHYFYAGGDFLVMPSRYEPCGLPQMCAQRYGMVPIVTLCGGLKDSVIVEPREKATGFGILPLDVHKYKEVVFKSVETYHKDVTYFRTMQGRGMQQDFAWGHAIDEYEMNIDWALGDPPFIR